MPREPQLDHVVLLLPYAQLQNLPAWVTDNFTVSEGGKHADGKTENKLVLFADGTYLELIAFVNDNPERRKGHWWDKPPGVVDFALTNLAFSPLASRLEQTGTGISYAPPKAGGRTKPDGTQLKWEVTFPQNVARGLVPFWCEDVTPRERRVPISEASTTHPSGVRGMKGMIVSIPSSPSHERERIEKAMPAITDASSASSAGGGYGVGSPRAVGGLEKPKIWVKERPRESGEESGEVLLTLVLQGGKEKGEVREEIGEKGLVSVVFE